MQCVYILKVHNLIHTVKELSFIQHRMRCLSELIWQLCVTRWDDEKIAKTSKVTYIGHDQGSKISSKICDKSQDVVTEDVDVPATKSIPISIYAEYTTGP